MFRIRPSIVYLIMIGVTGLLFRVIFTMSMLYQVSVAGLTPLQLVLVGTGLEVTMLIFEVPTGAVADTISRRLSIIIGVAITGIAFIIEGSVPTFPGILFASCLWGFGYTFTSGATTAWLYDEVGQEAAEPLLIRGQQVRQVAAIIGILLSVGVGLLAVHIPIIMGGAGFLLLALFLVLAMSEDGFSPTPAAQRETWSEMVQTVKTSAGLVRADRMLLLIFGATFIFGLYSEGYDRLWSPMLIEIIGLPGLPLPVWFGLFGLVGNLLGLIGTEAARRMRLTDEDRAARALQIITAVRVVALGAFALGPNLPVVLVAMWIFDTLRGISAPIHTAWINQNIRDSSVRATVLSMDGQMNAIGQIAGGPSVGLVGERIGIRAALTVSTVLLAPALPLLARASRRSTPPVEAEMNVTG